MVELRDFIGGYSDRAWARTRSCDRKWLVSPSLIPFSNLGIPLSVHWLTIVTLHWIWGLSMLSGVAGST